MNTTQQTAKHTPLPWQAFIQQEPFKPTCFIDCDAGMIRPRPTMPMAEIEANAEFIIRACNSHYELVKACKMESHLTHVIAAIENLSTPGRANDGKKTLIANLDFLYRLHDAMKSALTSAQGKEN